MRWLHELVDHSLVWMRSVVRDLKLGRKSARSGGGELEIDHGMRNEILGGERG